MHRQTIIHKNNIKHALVFGKFYFLVINEDFPLTALVQSMKIQASLWLCDLDNVLSK